MTRGFSSDETAGRVTNKTNYMQNPQCFQRIGLFPRHTHKTCLLKLYIPSFAENKNKNKNTQLRTVCTPRCSMRYWQISCLVWSLCSPADVTCRSMPGIADKLFSEAGVHRRSDVLLLPVVLVGTWASKHHREVATAYMTDVYIIMFTSFSDGKNFVAIWQWLRPTPATLMVLLCTTRFLYTWCTPAYCISSPDCRSPWGP